MTNREIRKRIRLYKALISFCRRSPANECAKTINIWYWQQKIENLYDLLNSNSKSKSA